MYELIDALRPVFIIGTFFGGFALLVHLFASHRLKNKIINAGKLEIDPTLLKALTSENEPNKLAALKWGLIVFCAGFGLIVNHYLAAGPNSILPWGIELTFVSIGFLAYFFIARNLENKA